jgi:hypothetical protein
MIEVLGVIDTQLSALGLNYEFGEMTQSPPVYPYWVGEYTEPEPNGEDGKEEPVILLSGFTRGAYIDLETQAELIRNYYKHGVTVLTDDGAAVIVNYAGSLKVPTGELELKKMQVNLAVRLWNLA